MTPKAAKKFAKTGKHKWVSAWTCGPPNPKPRQKLSNATPLPEQDRLLKYDAFESLFWTLRKRLRGDIQTPPDREEACAAVRDYFKRSARGWGPWANWADLPAW